MKHIFIINPISGQQNAAQFLRPRIEEAAERLGASVEIIETEYPGHGTQLSLQWAKWAEEQQEIVRIYACGGDGTLNEVMVGVKGSSWAQVACVPCGSGNDFIRNYGTKEDFLDLLSLMDGEAQVIDMIETNTGWSASICAAGLDAQVAYSIPKYRHLPFCGGSMAYYLSIAEQLCKKLGKQLSIEIDGEEIQQNCLLVAVCNGSYYGGGFYAAPNAALDDGLLDVVIVKKISLPKIATVLGIYQKGTHIQNGKVREDLTDIIELRRGRNVKIRSLEDKPMIVTLDGECSPQTEIRACVVPSCVSVVIPKKLIKKKEEVCVH